jgi:nucleoside-diphosphate-sugar epimerase
VRALARSVERGAELERLGCELVIGDLAAEATIAAGLEGRDALIHGAAIFEVGIPEDEHRAMYEANVLGTERVLGAALEAGTPKVVYVSTIGAFGNTHGRVVDESYRHPGGDFTSYYEQTKYEAHQVAERLIAERQLPCVIVQPGGVYGPDDHSAIGQQINQFLAGRMPLLVFPDLGMNMAHVDDIAAGILLALDKGRPGESYILGGEIITMRELMATVARVAGKRPPTRAVPTAALRALAPVGPLVGKLMGQPPNLRELISSGDGVTFWAKHDKAIAELGYSPRGLESGLRDTFEAEGKLPAAAA